MSKQFLEISYYKLFEQYMDNRSKKGKMFKRGNKLYSIFTGTCPKCHKESMYVNKNPYRLGSVYEMHESCTSCGVKYKMEPSFFFGAMYVSYALGTAFGVAGFIISFFVLKLSLEQTFFVIVGLLVGFMPIIMRMARNIWINFFIDFDPRSALVQPENERANGLQSGL